MGQTWMCTVVIGGRNGRELKPLLPRVLCIAGSLQADRGPCEITVFEREGVVRIIGFTEPVGRIDFKIAAESGVMNGKVNAPGKLARVVLQD